MHVYLGRSVGAKDGRGGDGLGLGDSRRFPVLTRCQGAVVPLPSVLERGTLGTPQLTSIMRSRGIASTQLKLRKTNLMGGVLNNSHRESTRQGQEMSRALIDFLVVIDQTFHIAITPQITRDSRQTCS